MAYITSFSNTWPKALAQRYPRHAIDIVVDIVSLPNKLLGLLHYNHIILRCRRTSTHLPLLKFDHTSRYTPPPPVATPLQRWHIITFLARTVFMSSKQCGIVIIIYRSLQDCPSLLSAPEHTYPRARSECGTK
jgi:hypothetical protein